MKSLFITILSFLSFPTFSSPISKNYSEIQVIMNELSEKNPKMIEKFNLGISDSGLPVEGLKFGNGPINNLVVSTHHGNEYGSTEVAKGLMEKLALTPIPGQSIFVIPVLNIGGYNSRQRAEVSGGVNHDPNRDYPGPCGTDGPFNLKSTLALAKFIDVKNIINSATLHTYYPAVVYPWGISTHDTSTPYDQLFIKLGQLATFLSGYRVGNSTKVIYPADGTYEDYAYWKLGIWSMLFELGYSHHPTQSDVDQMVASNVPGIIKMFQGAPIARVQDHDFRGTCDSNLKSLDLRDE